MSTCVMKQDNKVWEEKKSLHLTSLHLGVKRNAPITTLSSISWTPPGVAAPLMCQLTQLCGSSGQEGCCLYFMAVLKINK